MNPVDEVIGTVYLRMLEELRRFADEPCVYATGGDDPCDLCGMEEGHWCQPCFSRRVLALRSPAGAEA